MCGFAGAVVWDERYRVSPQTLSQMSAAVAHRGPDGQGSHHTRLDSPITPATPQVALAFRRLAILDPDPRSDQPFTDGRRTLVFNGEIYNFRELRSELKSLLPDYEWRTTGDTEVLLAAYSAWGEHCVDHLNGMFAFAVWDEAEKTLFLARDRMGQKPLYWTAATIAATPWTGLSTDANSISPPLAALAFASELSALLPLPWVDRQVDWAGINGYLRWGYIPRSRTGFRGIKKFSQGMGGTARYDAATARPYFFPSGLRLNMEVEPFHAVKRTRSLVEQAVQRQLVADVPIGCLLSGGIDSSVITAAAMKSVSPAGGRILTFSLGFGDEQYDETQYARAVAEHLGTDHHAFTASPDAAADLPALAAVLGEPFGDSSILPTHYLARAVRQHVKVALSGEGGDELFGGYERYRAMNMAAALDQTPWLVRRAAASEVWQNLPGHHPKSKMMKLKRFLATAAATPVDRYMQLMSIFNRKQISALFQGADGERTFIDDWQMAAEAVQKAAESRGPVVMATALDRVTYLPGDLLTKVDRASMLHALEIRSPFMDHDLVTFAAGLTTDQLLKGGPKRMLREAFAADLPAWVFKRKKMGFAVPIGEWFRGPLRAMLHDTLFSAHAFGRSHFNMAIVQRLVDEHESQRVDHSQRLYALLMLELWWNTVRAQ